MASKLRLFWAVNLPEELKNRIHEIRNRLGTAGGAKWVEPRNLHVTVKFLGDTDIDLVRPVVDSAAGRLKGVKSFSLEVGGLGFFPGTSSPRVLWAGLKGEVSLLGVVARMVEEAAAEHGFPRESRKFSPHVTLARIKSPVEAGELVAAVEKEKSRVESLGSFRVASVDLMKSDLTPRGPVYTLLSSVRLEGL